MEPLFSVVIPTYNRAYVLWKAIASVTAQTEPRWEIVVVNDGSTDCTLRMLEEFRDARIRVVNIPHQGAPAARNRGVENSHAPFIAYLDSDNAWHTGFLETMREAIEHDDDCVLWYCGQNDVCWERTADGQWFLISESAEPRKQYSSEEVWRLNGADTSCMVHRREIFEEVGGWDEECFWGEDWDFFLRIFLRYPDGVKWIPRIMVEYRQVFGTGADGICGEARENLDAEIRGRRYLLHKWNHDPRFAADRSLNKQAEDLKLMRAQA